MKRLFHEEPTKNALSFTLRREVEMNGPQMEDQLNLYGQSFSSRLLLGTARYDSPSLLANAISAADPAMLTVSLRRQISGSKESGQSFWNLLRETQRAILPNTAGCFNAREAVNHRPGSDFGDVRRSTRHCRSRSAGDRPSRSAPGGRARSVG